MAQSSLTHREYTLVLGASGGIGFAYAAWCAKAKQRLILVGRRRSKLTAARRQLVGLGATEVISRSGDLMNKSFRSRLLTEFTKRRISRVFIGGPTPPQWSRSWAVWQQAQQACNVCIFYPMQIAEAILKSQSGRVEAVFLSSSASKEPAKDHPFFWSATVRPLAELALAKLFNEHGGHGSVIFIWRPKVVYTELARQFAKSLPPCGEKDSLLNRLRSHFNASLIPSPEEYVERKMRKQNG